MFAAPRIVDTSRDTLYSHVIVVSDGTNEPFRWGNTSERPTRTWLTSASIREIGDSAADAGLTLAEFLAGLKD